jgi:hypothetical protein
MVEKKAFQRLQSWLRAKPFRTALLFCVVAFVAFQIDVRLTDPEYVAQYSLLQQVGLFTLIVVPPAFLVAFLVWWGRRRAAE